MLAVAAAVAKRLPIVRHPASSSVIQRHPTVIQNVIQHLPTSSKTSSVIHHQYNMKACQRWQRQWRRWWQNVFLSSYSVIQPHPTVIQNVIQRHPSAKLSSKTSSNVTQRNSKRHPLPKTSFKVIQTAIQRQGKGNPKMSPNFKSSGITA